MSLAFQILTFHIGGQRFGIALDAVQEVTPAVALVPLLSAPPIVLGIFSLRGQAVAVLDTVQRFGYPARPLSPTEHFMVCRVQDRVVALRVDQVDDIVACSQDQWQPISGITERAGQVAGVVQLADGMLLIHDVATFLTETESAELDAALANRQLPPQAEGRHG